MSRSSLIDSKNHFTLSSPCAVTVLTGASGSEIYVQTNIPLGQSFAPKLNFSVFCCFFFYSGKRNLDSQI